MTGSNKILGDKLFEFITYLLLAVFSLACIYPVYQSIVLSLNDGKDAMSGGIYFLPRVWSLQNYRIVFSNSKLLTGFLVTILRTVIGTFLSVMITSMLSFALAKKNLLFGKLYSVLCIFTMYFSGGLIPYYLLIRSLGMRDSFLVLVLPGVLNVFNMLIFKSFFKDIPESLEESAKIDGANYLTVFFKIIIQVSLPVYAALSLFTAVGIWNEWFTAMLFIDKRTDLLPLQTILNSIINQTTAIDELMKQAGGTNMAGKLSSITTKSIIVTNMVVITLPIIVVYPFLQKYFVKGVMLGSIKG